jgi:hypothetical protein
MGNERRIINRRKFGYYMPVFDNATNETLGYLSDISPRGFKLEGIRPLPVYKVYRMHLNLTAEIAPVSNIVFNAEVVWCEPSPYSPTEYEYGFQIVGINPAEQRIFERLVEKYSVT